MRLRSSRRIFLACILSAVLPAAGRIAQNPPPRPFSNSSHSALWQPPTSTDLKSHFERLNGREIWFVNGLPFTALGAETEWEKITYPQYRQTMKVYDYTYPAAEAMHLNTLKIPVKWSQIEPEEGQYDFSYPDHVKAMAEKYHLKIAFDWFGHYGSDTGTIYSNMRGSMYAPTWVIQDTNRFPRAVDGDGIAHNDAASYDYPAIIEAESSAFAAFMTHIRKIDRATHTIIGIQVENEVTVFNGTDRHNPKLWRDHSEASNRNFKQHHFTDDLKYTAWDYSTSWLRPVTEAGARADTLPFFMNFVGGQLEDGMVGGSPGEDVATYLDHVPSLTFIGLNNYVEDPENYSADDFRGTFRRYRIGRNLPSLTETNSGNTPFTERSLFLAVGEYGSPLFTPWSLIASYPENEQPYVLQNGQLANGAFALSAAYNLLNRALPAISYFGGTKNAYVFLADLPGSRFSKAREIGNLRIAVSGSENGQAIILQPSSHEFILIGYRCSITFKSSSANLPPIQNIRLETGRWIGGKWSPKGKVNETNEENGVERRLRIYLPQPEVVRVYW